MDNRVSEDQDALVNEGMNAEEPQEETESGSTPAEGSEANSDAVYVQKRLKRQERAHEREMREMQSRMDQIQSQLAQQSPPFQANPNGEPYGSDEERIHKAVSYGIQLSKQTEEKARREALQAKEQANLHKKYQDLSTHLNDYADKYDDFEEKVMGNDVPITPHIVHAASLLPKKGAGSAGETLYHLGKNPNELARISQLPISDQQAEVIALSHALARGNVEGKGMPLSQTLNPLKSMPSNASSRKINDSTSISDIRARMRAGTFK
jgi:hypothetical protein